MGTIELVKKHSRWIRWTHWINFPILILMSWSGILIYWANDVYRPFFPQWFYRIFHVEHQLALGMAVHFSMMWLFTINGLIYFCYLLFSGEWREIFPNSKSPRDALQVLLYSLGLSRALPHQKKFNAAQRIAYSGINLIGVLSLVSGLAIYKPIQLSKLTACLGGYEQARFLHFIGMTLYIPFFIIHIFQVMRAGWNNLRAMVIGYEVREIK